MNLQGLNDLDINDIASWPALAKSLLIAFVCALIGASGYYMLIADSIKKLDQTRQQEIELKSQFEVRASQASSLTAYREQMIQLEEMLKNQLKQLPNKNEVAGLLDDISYIATNNGLKLLRINWEPEIKRDFYTELPMRIDLSGQYNQLGQFSADIAALPRIVLLGSFTVNKEAKDGAGNLIMSVQAKTYRYDPDQKQNKVKGKVKK
ncbi:MAG: type 4a pilus biogenesis protein PilO [Tolumonas sp.]|nr:type 4a pilus biogenesis protein PilO [Tolumonas sp.]